MKSLNQLYKEQVKYKLTSDPFNKWVEKGKDLYQKMLNTDPPMIAEDVTFEMFANMVQPQLELHDDGSTSTTSFWDSPLGKILTTGVTVGADIIKQQNTPSTSATTTTSTATNPPVPTASKTILGLQPVVFYSITTVVVLATAYGIYKLVSKKA